MLTSELSSLEKKVVRQLDKFLTKQCRDPTFATNFLFAVDSRIQRWLEECMPANTRDEVDDNIINFNRLISQVLDRMFYIDLPSAFKLPGPPQTESPVKKALTINWSPPKPDNEESRKVRNRSQVPGFSLKPGEQWQSFCRAYIDDSPDWDNDGFKMCAHGLPLHSLPCPT